MHRNSVAKPLTPDGRHLLTGVLSRSEAVVQMWDVETGKEARRFPTGDVITSAVAVSPDGRLAASMGNRQVVNVWNLEGDPALLTIGRGPGMALAFSPDSRSLLSGADDGSVWQIDLTPTELKLSRTFVGIVKQITAVAYSADGALVAASALDGKVLVWDAASGKVQHEWQLPGPVHGVSFDARGRHLAIANANATVFILRLETTSEQR